MFPDGFVRGAASGHGFFRDIIPAVFEGGGDAFARVDDFLLRQLGGRGEQRFGILGELSDVVGGFDSSVCSSLFHTFDVLIVPVEPCVPITRKGNGDSSAKNSERMSCRTGFW